MLGPNAQSESVATPFNDDWSFRCISPSPSQTQEWCPISLPHDAMLSAGCSANAPSSTHGAFFLGGSYMYRKTWHVPESLRGKKTSLLFDGVYRHSRVLVNGTEVGGCVSGWTAFEVDISMAVKYGGEESS